MLCSYIKSLHVRFFFFGEKFYSINGDPVDIDPECVSHDDYLTEFKSMLITALRNAIDADTANDPDCTKGRKKTVQVSDFKYKYKYKYKNLLFNISSFDMTRPVWQKKIHKMLAHKKWLVLCV